MDNWINIIQDYLFPPNCIFCFNKGHHSQDICTACLNELILNKACCYRCAQPLSFSVNQPVLCGHCQKNVFHFDEVFAPFLYQSYIKYLIIQLKYHRQYQYARLLGYLMSQHIKTHVELPERIIPVPIHPNRLKQRGFNQSTELACALSGYLNISVDNKICYRVKDTPRQTGNKAVFRHQNLKNAFQCQQSPSYSHVAILDDVMTTGSTVNELAKTLKSYGVERVDCWILARATLLPH